MERSETLRRRINSLSSQICRAKKDGLDTSALEAQRSELQAERKNLKHGRTMENLLGMDREEFKAKARNAKQVTVPKTQSRTGYHIDANKVQAACDELGITRPVKIKWTNGRTRVGATYLKDNGTWINITVTGLQGEEDWNEYAISAILWHELKHAAQMESFQDAMGFWQAYKKHGYSGYAYDRNPYEVEARQCATDHAGQRLTR